jgi:regulator of protease activity HflC (stomatin/prohibitin superfamily)
MSLLGFILAGILIVWGVMRATERVPLDKDQRRRLAFTTRITHPTRLVLSILGALTLYLVVKWSFLLIPGGHVACVYDPTRGGIQSYTLPEGLRMILPWDKTAIFSVQTQEYTMSISPTEGAVLGDDSIKCETNEGLKVVLDLSILFHVDPQKAPDVWRRLGDNYITVFVRPVVRERIRMVVAKYGVQEIYSGKRTTIEEEITEELREPFSQEGLLLEQILLRNVEYANKEFAAAIAEKQARQQQVITEKRNLERAQYDKAATVNQAQGDAQSLTLRAQTLAGNPEVVKYELAKKIAPRVRKAYLSQGAVPLPGGGE